MAAGRRPAYEAIGTRISTPHVPSTRCLGADQGGGTCGTAAGVGRLARRLADALDGHRSTTRSAGETREALALTGRDVGTPILHFSRPTHRLLRTRDQQAAQRDDAGKKVLWDHVIGWPRSRFCRAQSGRCRERRSWPASGSIRRLRGKEEDWHGGSRRTRSKRVATHANSLLWCRDCSQADRSSNFTHPHRSVNAEHSHLPRREDVALGAEDRQRRAGLGQQIGDDRAQLRGVQRAPLSASAPRAQPSATRMMPPRLENAAGDIARLHAATTPPAVRCSRAPSRRNRVLPSTSCREDRLGHRYAPTVRSH